MLTLEEISARMEIHDALMRYCRGIDRRDAAMIESAYFPDAVDIRAYTDVEATPAVFAKRAVDGFGETPDFSLHHLTNEIIELDLTHDAARVESYVIAMHPVGPMTSLVLRPADGESHVRLFSGRYLDSFERREGEWRIAKRIVTIELSRDDIPGETVYQVREDLAAAGVGADPSYTLLGMRPA